MFYDCTVGKMPTFKLIKNLQKIWRQNKSRVLKLKKFEFLCHFGRENVKMCEKCGAKISKNQLFGTKYE